MRIRKLLILIILFLILLSPITIILGKLTATKNIIAEADTYIDLDSNANYGGDSNIIVLNSEYSTYIGIIRFDLMSIFNSTIGSATLKLKSFIVYETTEIGIHTCSDISWNELTINSIPTYSQSALDTTLVASDGTWYSWDVTNAVNSSFPNEKITFVIKAKNKIEGISLGAWMYSRELKYEPTLTVDYSTGTSINFPSFVILIVLTLSVLRRKVIN